MPSIGEVEASEEVQEEVGSRVVPKGCKVKEKTPLHVSISQRGLLGYENAEKGFLNVFTSFPKFPKFASSNHNLASPSGKFRQIVEERDEVSRSVPSSTSQGFRERFNMRFREMNWDSLREICKGWIRNPMNMALLVWIICVAVSGAILFMVMIGMLNHVLPRKQQRNAWFEVNNQILNALFTLMCLYQHPKRIYHLVLLCRWRPGDISRLRKIYCKNGTYKPHEWANMMVVVGLLNLNCFAQYALCSLNLGYKRSERPAIGVGITITVAIASAATAGLYTILSPLGREYESEIDEEAQNQIIGTPVNKPNNIRAKSLEKRFSFALRDDQRVVENRPEWSGGLFDLWDDISLAYLTLFCSFCVFGWNMERLGFGNMYVHIATFLLFCTAPFFIFNLAAINIDNEVVQEALGITGIVLCIFGFLYGGFWRIQMRKRFNLPANYFCCGNPAMTDCVQWLFCCWCSLAQEVRTVDSYDIVEDKFYRKEMSETDRPVLTPLARENGSVQSRLSQGSPLWSSSSPSKPGVINSPSPRRYSNGYDTPNGHLPMLVEGSSTRGEDRTMTPPSPLSIQREGDQPGSTAS
ncbi:Uncharacterized protein family Cys-rich [Macleaya cordata]|uniref:Uncharacterized protein family Cys-rich n=1 Tax=Macleaya cordata TaxID=56857 RepID=A0A200R3C8_MACCD|nr:Uncharacterized protein family Cys-rich [Macleaya cordata]